ncbi:glycosyltransferase family 2 protein [Terribacillus saccharophilus]|uniref:glycosyltransferase family 2 protein n=1 Tax=Terribacillus saccharophilus TaxID=361277 RepID=UPI000BA60418|nr:glycosyltransferase family 2 protein [Terribacillus saccharophilus]PAF18064.1 hypothetical protein CHH51_09465 [Terribacillus saccharophilus]
MKKKPFVSLCMIVKNEEKVIKRCLDSVVDLIEDIIIVDTGSTDSTIKIIQEYENIQLFNFEWNNSFADARNFAASHAQGEWILVLDADEFLEPTNARAVLDDLKNSKDDVYAINIVNFVGSDGNRIIENKHVRLYKNSGVYKYTRAIHEQITHKDSKNFTIKLSELIAYHSGYMEEVVKNKQKTKRNKKLIDLQLKREKDGFDYYNLGNELKTEKKYEQALNAYVTAYKKKVDPFINWVPICLLNMTETLILLDRHNDALNVLQDAIRIYQDSADFLFIKGSIYLSQGRLEDAKQVFTLILNEKSTFKTVVKSSDSIEYLPLLRLGKIYELENNIEKAVTYYSKALNINNRCFDSLTSLMKILAVHTSAKETFELARPYLEFNQYDVIRFLLNEGLHELLSEIVEHITLDKDVLDIIEVKIAIINFTEVQEDWLEKDEQKLAKALKLRFIDAGDIYLLHLLKPAQELSDVYRNIILNSVLGFTIDDHYDKDKLKKEDYTLEFCYMIKKLVKYQNYKIANELLEQVSLFSPSIYAKLGGILFKLSQQDLAITLYEKSDEHNLEKQDYLNIVLWLKAQGNLTEANRIAKEALTKFKDEYLFYEQIIETDENPEPYLMEALNLYKDSIWLEEKLLRI